MFFVVFLLVLLLEFTSMSFQIQQRCLNTTIYLHFSLSCTLTSRILRPLLLFAVQTNCFMSSFRCARKKWITYRDVFDASKTSAVFQTMIVSGCCPSIKQVNVIFSPSIRLIILEFFASTIARATSKLLIKILNSLDLIIFWIVIYI